MSIQFVLLIIFFLIIVFYYFDIKTKEQFILNNYNSSKYNLSDKYNGNNKYNEYIDDYIDIPENENIFVEGQFHTDYRDTITSFNNLVPAQKQLFNLENIPIKRKVFTNNNTNEVNKLVNDFIYELNKNVAESVSNYRNGNSGWDEVIPDKKIESGWEKHMKSLELPQNLYPEPAVKSKVDLISISNLIKYETDHEIKYSCELLIKKENVKDKLLVKISFVINKNSTKNIMIEEIHILGFYTQNGKMGVGIDNPDDFYNFKNMENQEIVDRGTIVKQLINKYNNRNKDMTYFNSSLNGFNASLTNFNGPLSKEQKEFRNEVPHESTTDSYQVTQTIFDDLYNKNQIKVHGEN